MNVIRTVRVRRGEREYFDIEVDGMPLAHHFAGRLGAHPPLLSALGWSTASKEHIKEVVAQFLTEMPSGLGSGRVPLLVCEMCGDTGCGAIAAKVRRDGNVYLWTDWAYENGYEPPAELTWSVQPGDLIFERTTYESEIRKAL